MKQVSERLVSEVLRLVPYLIDQLPKPYTLRLENTVRQLNIILKKLKKLQDKN